MSTSFLRRSSILFATAAAFLAFACTGTSDADDNETAESAVTADGQPGSHVGVHGMTLFGGAEKLYLSHIPLYQAPHNKQVVVEVSIASGVPADALATFGTNNFTVRPSAFSLYDLGAGAVQTVTGTIYFGNFESGGRPVFANVKFNVNRVIVNRVMGPATPKSQTLDYVAVGSPANAYLVHLIDATPSFDQVLSVKLEANSFLDANSLSTGALVKINGGTNGIRTRLAPNANVQAETLYTVSSSSSGSSGTSSGSSGAGASSGSSGAVGTLILPPATDASAGGVPVTDAGVPVQKSSGLTVVKELGCLPGPDFYGTCPAAAVQP